MGADLRRPGARVWVPGSLCRAGSGAGSPRWLLAVHRQRVPREVGAPASQTSALPVPLATRVFNKQRGVTSVFIYLHTGASPTRPTGSPCRLSSNLKADGRVLGRPLKVHGQGGTPPGLGVAKDAHPVLCRALHTKSTRRHRVGLRC